MFTGIVEHVGTVVAVTPRGKVVQLTIDCGPIVEGVHLGDSIAINGTDLTVTTMAGASLRFEMVQETAGITNLGQLRPGSRVNLERALRADGRYDGHIVQGHVDTTGTCKKIRDKRGSHEFTFEFPKKFAELIIEKGSICVNGISLTAFDVKKHAFSVAIIPYTFEHTNLMFVREGDLVNLEFDMIGKYILRHYQLLDK